VGFVDGVVLHRGSDFCADGVQERGVVGEVRDGPEGDFVDVSEDAGGVSVLSS